MDRRRFIKVVGFCSLFVHGWLRELLAAQGPMVSVAQGANHAETTRRAIAALGGMQRFVKPGQTVVVKPNIGWDRAPEYAATSNPIVVRTVVEECLKSGAKKVKVFDRTCNDPRRCYRNSGIEAALKGMPNVEVKHLEEERYRKVFLNGRALKECELYGEALSADVYINLPVAKHHSLSGLTLGMKNVMGIMGGNRGSIHKHINQALADVNAVFKSHLTIIDATRILTAHGPQGGSLADVRVLNKIIASTDIVAADAYATTLFGLKPSDIAVTRTAYRRGLGEMNLEKMRIVHA
ncbi:MAG: cytoplasmic protein [Geobacteraceae bacterium GWC2_58_44]|nr:MAG: cytoplasmic protein [Geobacteraceae bacterium GWC2_58_44]HBG04369.1 cytoplasmic protein [Geobacter sp.]